MKRIIASLAIGFSALTGQAHAWVGGPFDNGFVSKELEVNSIYQAVLSFKNGSGFCYFSPTQRISSNDASVPAAVDQRGSFYNRSVLYFKGISYVGSALGMTDGAKRYIQCTLNGSSESTYQTAASQQQTSAFTLASSTSSALSTTVVSSSRAFNFNGQWEGQFLDNSPEARFTGKGELAFLAPGGADSIAGLAFSGFAGLIDAIITAVGNTNTTGTTAFPATFFSDAGTAITGFLTQMADPTTAIGSIISKSGIDPTYENATIVKMKVNGTRRFL